jgi:hypothetical protein
MRSVFDNDTDEIDCLGTRSFQCSHWSVMSFAWFAVVTPVAIAGEPSAADKTGQYAASVVEYGDRKM